MPGTTDVYLITGFLGSGKTTFLNRIIKRFPSDKKLTLLVNEFGEIGVDGTLVEGEDIDTMEISKGSIFCVCVKTDFIKGLYALNTTVQPDVLLIESTGVANPSDLKKDLQLPIFNDRFKFRDQFCIIDGQHFLDAFQVFASVEKQIASSSVFIINKTDVTPADKIAEIKGVVGQFHPDPHFFETAYADIPLDQFFDLQLRQDKLEDQTEDKSEDNAGDDTSEPPVLSDQQLDQFIDDLLDSPELQITPPDALLSVAYRFEGDSLDDIKTMAAALPASVVRAKGFITEQAQTYIFNYVMGDWTIETPQIDLERIEHRNVLVFIGPPEVIDAIADVLNDRPWTLLGSYQPFTE